MLKILLWLLLAAGLAMGPVYWGYATFHSGSVAARLPLTPRGDGSLHSPAFRLTTEQSPVGLILHAPAEFSPNMTEDRPPVDRYLAILQRDGDKAEPLKFELKAGSVGNTNPVFNEHLLLMNVQTAGEYQLEVVPMGPPSMKLGKAELIVHQQVVTPDSRIVTGGIALFALAIMALVLI